MTNYHSLIQPDNGQSATPIHVVDKNSFEEWLKSQSDAVRAAIRAQKFAGGAGDIAILPGIKADEWAAVAGVSDADKLGIWSLAKSSDALPEGMYRLVSGEVGDAMLGWMLGQYEFDTYRSEPKATPSRVLLVKEPGRIEGAAYLAEATAMVRDLVNIPAAGRSPAYW
jgi:leucyl aminopeptidase